jgi:hypothetical protein
VATARPLHEMVGLPAGASADELRRAYEAAMSAATRTGEHQRAVSLSKAFDELSASKRHELYARNDLARNRIATTAPTYIRERAPRRARRRFERIVALSLSPAIIIAAVIVFVHYRESGSAPGPATVSPESTISITQPAANPPVLPAAPTPTAN